MTNTIEAIPEILAREINGMLRDDELVKSDPGAVATAMRIAGAYRLQECVGALVDRIAFVPRRPLEEEMLRPRSPEESVPAVYALIKIGKASIPAVLRLASDPKTERGPLAGAGRVLLGVEGESAAETVEAFVRKSENPEQTRRMLEREPFKRYWQAQHE